MRTGKPCSTGNGSPFIPNASRASRPSVIVATGVPDVHPSADVLFSWSASGCTPASSKMSASGTPSHFALPISLPPTSFDTHVSVMSRSTTLRFRRSSNVNSSSRSTMPCTFRRHDSAVICGTESAVSIR